MHSEDYIRGPDLNRRERDVNNSNKKIIRPTYYHTRAKNLSLRDEAASRDEQIYLMSGVLKLDSNAELLKLTLQGLIMWNLEKCQQTTFKAVILDL